MVHNNNSSGALLLGNTSELNSEELKNFITLSEEINERQRLSDQHTARNSLPIAHLKRQEIFECSPIDDDKFLSALEHQNSFLGCTQITDLDVTQSFENILKYFDEDVNCRSSNSSTPTLKHIGNRVASAVAKLKPKASELRSTHLNKSTKKELSIKYPSVKALKSKYEPVVNQTRGEENDIQSTKNSAVKNVKEIAQIFNNKISQIINAPMGSKTYAKLENELSPGALTMPKSTERNRPKLPIYSRNKSSPVVTPNLKRKIIEHKSSPMSKESPAAQKSNEKFKPNFAIYRDNKASPVGSPNLRRKKETKDKENDAACLVTEEVFQKLSVKDKALLYQKFIEDMSMQSAEFKQHAKQLKEHVRNKFIEGGVVVEKQQKVKQLAQQIEAKMGLPRQTVSDTAMMPYMPRYRTLRNNKITSNTVRKAKEAEDANQNNEDFPHVSELKVYLKSPNKGEAIFSSQHLTHTVSPDKEEIPAGSSSFKRRNNMIRHTYSTEAYAPPKKIRRTRAERLTPKTVFQNTKIVSMFYVWLKEKNGVSFDIKSSNESIEQDTNKSEDVSETIQVSTNTLETTLDWSNSKVEQEPEEIKCLDILNKELPPLESPRLCQMLQKPMEEIKMENEVKIKRQAPPIPTIAHQANECTSSESLASCKPSEIEESESSAVSVPKVNIKKKRESITVSRYTHDVFVHLQLNTDTDLQADAQKVNSIPVKEIKEQKDDFKFLKPTRPARRKKMRRTLSWKKENFIVESAPIVSTTPTTTTTDSDSDGKAAAAEAKKKNTTIVVQKAMKKCNNQLKKFIFSSTSDLKEQSELRRQSINELNKSLLRALNSPHKIKSAYTLTVLTSPSPYTESEQGGTETLRSSICRETSRSLPSIGTAFDEEQLKPNDLQSTSMEISQNKQHVINESIRYSLTDQGFETGSNEMEQSLLQKREKTKSPLFFKLSTPLKKPQQQYAKRESSDSACESQSSCSTPLNDNAQERVSINSHNGYISPLQQAPPKPRRRMLTDAESRRSSIAMQVIREDQPLDVNETHNVTKLPIDKNEINSGRTSSFWITAGDFTTSIPIYYNSPDRVRLLLDIFCQKSNEGDWHFGIDNHKFAINKPDEEECISKRLSTSKDTSHYWFSTGDLAVPFNGKYFHPNKILRLFKFIRENLMDSKDACLRFGIDEFEFSRMPDNISTAQKFSLESSYSSCIRLQGNDSFAYEDRPKYSWPNNTGNMMMRPSYQSEVEVEASDSSRMSITPMSGQQSTGYNSPYSGRESETDSPFRFSFGHESLDKLFEHRNKINTIKSTEKDNSNNLRKNNIEKMLKAMLKAVEEKIH